MKRLKDKVLFLYAFFCVSISVGFIALHVTAPSDGARLKRGTTIFFTQGAVLSPYATDTSLLQDGDILVAVQGITIRERAAAFFTPTAQTMLWKKGNSLEYTIVRGGRELKLQVPQVQLPLRAILAENWGLLIFTLLTQGVAAFILLEKPSDPPAQAFFIWAFSASHMYSWSFFMQASDLVFGTGFWAFRLAGTGLWLIFWAAAVHLLLIFPRPLLAPRNRHKVLLVLYASPFILFGAFVSSARLKAPDVLTWWNSWSIGEFSVGALFILPAILLMLVQYITVHSEDEKKKVRLLIFGGLFSTVLGMGLHFLPELFLNRSFLTPNGLGLINFPFIIGIAIAIWRYRLFDIDLIIRKTLVYSLLTGLLGALYFGSVALLQGLLTTSGGRQPAASSQPSPVVIVITTLAIYALFDPIRKHLQNIIDRRFYRQKYDAEKALAEFAAVARNETDLPRLADHLTGTVQDTMQPVQVSLWLAARKTSPPGGHSEIL